MHWRLMEQIINIVVLHLVMGHPIKHRLISIVGEHKGPYMDQMLHRLDTLTAKQLYNEHYFYAS